MSIVRNVLATGLALAVAGSASAGIVDRMEAGRLVTKGWRPNAWPTSGMVVRQGAMPYVVTAPSGRVTYSPAFQAPEGTAVESGAVIAPATIIVAQPSSRGLDSTPASLGRDVKRTYRNSR